MDHSPIHLGTAAEDPAIQKPPSFGAAFRFWLKLGFISFGGPAGQIAVMHHELVERKRWISNARFSDRPADARRGTKGNKSITSKTVLILQRSTFHAIADCTAALKHFRLVTR